MRYVVGEGPEAALILVEAYQPWCIQKSLSLLTFESIRSPNSVAEPLRFHLRCPSAHCRRFSASHSLVTAG